MNTLTIVAKRSVPPPASCSGEHEEPQPSSGPWSLERIRSLPTSCPSFQFQEWEKSLVQLHCTWKVLGASQRHTTHLRTNPFPSSIFRRVVASEALAALFQCQVQNWWPSWNGWLSLQLHSISEVHQTPRNPMSLHRQSSLLLSSCMLRRRIEGFSLLCCDLLIYF